MGFATRRETVCRAADSPIHTGCFRPERKQVMHAEAGSQRRADMAERIVRMILFGTLNEIALTSMRYKVDCTGVSTHTELNAYDRATPIFICCGKDNGYRHYVRRGLKGLGFWNFVGTSALRKRL